MKTLLMVLEFLIAVSLIGVVLLQPPKGEGMGSIGGQAHMFHQVRGLNAGLDRLCIGLAVAFVGIAILLSVMS